ncbi:MAG TPA: hypothetical protein DIT13_05440 [Verrucomicrobiales bacterium]|nr:hypothetical protein [Verrucomicrobiales bacterium]HRJ08046.1 S8 family serine peptidase [Prosthecobacter sp.]HRK15115.1 S8 family serine peptidase [Prosthecobacter sp.]
MQNGLKILIVLSALVCAAALVMLGGLALETTAPDRPVKISKPLTNWGAGDRRGSGPDFSLPPPDAAVDDLAELMRKLLELSRSPGVEPDELLLSFKSRAALDAFRARAARDGIEVLYSDPRLLTARVRYGDTAAMARELRDNAGAYDNIGMNFRAWVPAPQRVPETDTANAGGMRPYGDSGLDAIGAAGDRATWGKGVTVAVLDTGITPHPVLEHSSISRTDFVQDGKELDGHGTAMASLIAGEDPQNGGVAPASRLLDIRVANGNGESNTALVAQGILAAVDQGARVINISLGTNADSLTLRRAVEYAIAQGVIVVAAAGNDQSKALAYPAGYTGVVSVAAVDANGVQAFFSNSGPGLFISAPGVGIVSAYSGDGMVISSGTSQATALTSGAVAAMLSRGYNTQNVMQALVNNARPTGLPATQTGAGILQVPRL